MSSEAQVPAFTLRSTKESVKNHGSKFGTNSFWLNVDINWEKYLSKSKRTFEISQTDHSQCPLLGQSPKVGENSKSSENVENNIGSHPQALIRHFTVTFLIAATLYVAAVVPERVPRANFYSRHLYI